MKPFLYVERLAKTSSISTLTEDEEGGVNKIEVIIPNRYVVIDTAHHFTSTKENSFLLSRSGGIRATNRFSKKKNVQELNTHKQSVGSSRPFFSNCSS